MGHTWILRVKSLSFFFAERSWAFWRDVFGAQSSILNDWTQLMMVCRGSEPKPSFATGILGGGGNPTYMFKVRKSRGNGWFAKWMAVCQDRGTTIYPTLRILKGLNLYSRGALVLKIASFEGPMIRAGGGFNYFFDVHLYLRKLKPFWLYNIFRMGWFNHQLVSHVRW